MLFPLTEEMPRVAWIGHALRSSDRINDANDQCKQGRTLPTARLARLRWHGPQAMAPPCPLVACPPAMPCRTKAGLDASDRSQFTSIFVRSVDLLSHRRTRTYRHWLRRRRIRCHLEAVPPLATPSQSTRVKPSPSCTAADRIGHPLPFAPRALLILCFLLDQADICLKTPTRACLFYALPCVSSL
jgi:hypothetical protein